MSDNVETIVLEGGGPATALELLERLTATVAGVKNKIKRAVKDILIKEDEHVRAIVPGEFLDLPHDEYPVWSREDMTTLFNHLCPDWEILIRNGAIDRPISLTNERYRVNMLTYGGDFSPTNEIGFPGRLGMAVRIYRSDIPDLRTLGLPQKIANIAESRTGLLIVTGPVGNGKTTTCASFVDYINATRSGHIVTCEDPIEYIFEPKKCVITQRELGSNIESMARGAMDAMREFPETILIGEIREPDAAQAALYTGNAGQFVLGSMHANNAVQSISKLNQFFPAQEAVKAEDIASCLQGVISQVLVPSINGKSWVPIFETLHVDSAVRDLIAKRAWSELQRFVDESKNDGCVSRNISLQKAVVGGLIAPEQAMRASLDRSALAGMLKVKP